MRKERTVVIDAEGRDKGKRFLIREMPATQGEKWGLRALSAIMASGMEIPEEIAELGMAGVAAMGVQVLNGFDFNRFEPLLDEMFDCIQICPDPAHPELTRPLIEDDIEEILTRLRLRKEVLDLHTGFFSEENLSKLTSGTRKKKT